MRKTLIAILMALALVVIPVGSALAASSVDVNVTATPAFISLSVAPDPATWEINGIAVPGTKIKNNTTYYATVAPITDITPPSGAVLDTECRFTFTNNGDLPINITCIFLDFTGILMLNSDGGYAYNDTTKFGASGYESGKAWPGDAVIFMKADSDTFITNLAKDGTKKWGVAIRTQSGSFTAATPMESKITCTATEYIPP